MRMHHRGVIPVVSLPALLGAAQPLAGSLEAQETGSSLTSSIAPAALRPDGGDWTPAVEFELAGRMRRHVVRPAFPRSPYARFEARGAIALDAEENTEQIRALGAAGIAVDLYKAPRVAFTPTNPDAPDSVPGFDYGTVSLGAQLDLRTDQRAREVLGAAQLELLYFHDHQSRFWPFLPAVAIAYGLRRPLRSELRDDLAIDEVSHAQLDVNAFWHLSLDRAFLPAPVRRLWIHGEVRYFGAFGREEALETAGLDEGSYVTAALAYRARRPVLKIHEVFLRWSDGELQTRPADRRAWMLGIVIGDP